MTLEELDRWLDVYGRAWERQDRTRSSTASLRTRSTPGWGDPLRGHAVIRARTEQAVSQQENVHFGHEPLAITPDGRGIARWWVSIEIPGEDTVEENEGIFLVTLDDGGLCTEFREWWNSRSRPAE